MKSMIALGLCGIMTMSLAGCQNGTGSGDPTTGQQAGGAAAPSTEYTTDAHRDITIGSWWRQYYASGDTMEDSIDWVNAQFAADDSAELQAEKEWNQGIAQHRFDNVAFLEDKYNCSFTWVNLTYTGTKESLQTSTLAGTPDCDIYQVDTPVAVPAQTNGLLLDLKTVLPADHDLFTDQRVLSYLDLGDGKACIIKYQGGLSNTYPLGFNVQMLEQEGLEDPRELYARGEWTWDKFIEYCQKLTQDTDGDGQTDQYGFCGYLCDTFAQLLFSNGAAVAGSTTQTLTSAETGEVLQFLNDMYNTYKICYPYDYEYTSDGNITGSNPSDSMRDQYNQGNIAFFPIAVWKQNANGNYPMDGSQGNLTWDTAYVQWPVGPSGDQATNPGVNSADGNWFVIPVNVDQPALVANFLYDLYGWWQEDYDSNPIDDPKANNWWYKETAKDEALREANYAVQNDCLSRPGLELWESLAVPDMSLERLIDGTYTPASFQETFAQPVQDALDATFGN